MKHIILSLSLITGMFFSVNAQEQTPKYKVSIGPDFLYALGSTAEFYNIGYGASLQGEYKLSPKLSATLSAGYNSIATSKLYKAIFNPWGGNVSNTIVYPAKAGLKYIFHKNFYLSAEAGAAISPKPQVRATSFAYSGGAGASFEISSKSSIDIGIRYEEWALSVSNRYSFAGIRAAYVFGF